MPKMRFGNGIAATEHLMSGLPLTRLEAITLFGVQNLADLVSNLRREGWQIESKRVPYAKAAVRLKEFIKFEPPSNLPIREILITEYVLKK